MEVLLLKLEYLITGINYNTYQHTSKSSNKIDSICIANAKTQKSITRAKTGWEEEKKERMKKEEGDLEEK